MSVIYPIQYLRFAAAISVVLYHAGLRLEGVAGRVFETHLRFLAGGVDIFFVISGMIMFLTVTRSTPGPREFLLRRIIRIVPLYWCATLFLAGAAATGLAGWIRLTPETLLKSLFFIPYYAPGRAGEIYPLLVPGWTLNYEMYFYVIFAAALMIRGNLLASLYAYFALAFILGRLISSENPVFVTFTSPLILEFCLGLLAGWLWQRGRVLPPGLALALIPLCLILAWLGQHRAEADPLWRLLLWGGPAFGIVLAALSLKWLAQRHPLALLLGDASYAIYIFHTLLLFGLVKFFELAGLDRGTGTGEIAFALSGLGLAMGLGVAIHLWLERPMTRALRRWFLPRKPAVS